MGQTRLVSENFDMESGVAMVTLRYKNQEFTECAICHGEDADMKSELVGLALAHKRASIEVVKYRIKELENRIRVLEGAFRQVACSKDFDLTSRYSSNFQNLICNSRCERHELQKVLEQMKDNMQKDLESRDELYNKIRERRKKESGD